MEEKRINKAISDTGYCSRRAADKLIEENRVTVNDKPVELGQKVTEKDIIKVDGKKLGEEPDPVYIAFNKPVGIECTTNRKVKDNIIDFINYPERIFPIGRLDKDSEGLILLTNNGNIVNKILRANYGHEKEYIVQVNKELTADFIKGMSSRVPILDTVTNKSKVTQINRDTFKIILTQGLNRQIRRMTEYFGYKVVNLQRIRVMNINLGSLPVGVYRDLSPLELKVLKETIKNTKKISN
ncbi:MAG: pseudouridine synthase [Clostridium sp.]|nr:pseudouridine synthase [Clostridium sp.]